MNTLLTFCDLARFEQTLVTKYVDFSLWFIIGDLVMIMFLCSHATVIPTKIKVAPHKAWHCDVSRFIWTIVITNANFSLWSINRMLSWEVSKGHIYSLTLSPVHYMKSALLITVVNHTRQCDLSVAVTSFLFCM